MNSPSRNPAAARHARLFELIRQQNLMAARSERAAGALAELTDAQGFIEAARATLHRAA